MGDGFQSGWDLPRWYVRRVDDGADRGKMTLEFLWIQQALDSSAVVSHETPALHQWCCPIFVDGQPRQLSSGVRFTLRTTDPDGFPLPSPVFIKWQERLHTALRASIKFQSEEDIPLSLPELKKAQISDDDEDEDEFWITDTPHLTMFYLRVAMKRGDFPEEELPMWRRRFGLPPGKEWDQWFGLPADDESDSDDDSPSQEAISPESGDSDSELHSRGPESGPRDSGEPEAGSEGMGAQR
jgi:hypothetical protein